MKIIMIIVLEKSSDVPSSARHDDEWGVPSSGMEEIK